MTRRAEISDAAISQEIWQPPDTEEGRQRIFLRASGANADLDFQASGLENCHRIHS